MRVLSVLIRLEGGGAEASVRRVVAPLAERGIELTRVACQTAWEGEETDKDLTLASNQLPPLISLLVSPFRLGRIVRNVMPDVIHVHCERPELVVAAAYLLRVIRDIPIVVTEHTRNPWKGSPGVGRYVRRYLKRRQAVFVSCFGLSGGYQATIRNPTLIGRSQLAPASAAARVLIIGRLNAGKRVEWILDAVRSLSRMIPILVIGEGPSRKELETLAKTLRLDVTFLGYQKSPWDFARTGDLYVSASSYEGEPLAVVEAAAHGLPLLLSNIDAHRELLGSTASKLFASAQELSIELSQAVEPNGLSHLRMPTWRVRQLVTERDPIHVAGDWSDLYLRVVRDA